MKKDQKYLLKLEEELSKLSKKKRDAIISKYREIIDSEKSKSRRIKDILDSFGEPDVVAKKEIEELKKNSFFKRIFKKKEKVIKEENIIIDNSPKEENVEIEESEIEQKKIVKEKQKKTEKKSKKKKKTSKIKFDIKKLFKKKTKTEKIVEEVKKDAEEIIENTLEAVSEKKIFETKKQRIKRIVINTLYIIFMSLCIFLFLWSVVIFIASLFSLLDGVKVYGVVVALFALMLLVLWFVLLFYVLLYKKKVKAKFFIISILCILFVMGGGIGYSFKQYYSLKSIKDVSEKYNMTTFFQKYNLSSKKKLYISFNSNYDTKYIVEYDDELDDQIKLEVKYYENYYDFYAKKTNNNLYISLKIDTRDRLSVYIDDLKENKLFDKDELSRYTVKITMNELDKDRVVID